MPLASTRYAIAAGSAAANHEVITPSRTYNKGELVVVNYSPLGKWRNQFAIWNSGATQNWILAGGRDGSRAWPGSGEDDKPLKVWYCIMDQTQAMTITVTHTSQFSNGFGAAAVEVFTGYDPKQPIPHNNFFDGGFGTDVLQSITPRKPGSMLRFWCLDTNAGNSFSAPANCTLIEQRDEGIFATWAWLRPTVDPRPDAAAFSIGELDTGGRVFWIAYEIQEADPAPIPLQLAH